MISHIKQLIKEAGDICLKSQPRLTAADVAFKSPKDLVTVIDQSVEKFLISRIQSRWPDHAIFGEETGVSGGSGPYRWIIDPIDGTTSFFHQLPFYAISIGLEKNGELILGVVYVPALNQMFSAQTGKGSFLNDTPINVSQTKRMNQAVMATGFACLRAGHEPNNLAHFNRIVPQLRDIRRHGSAAIDLCYTAMGSFDGFWEMSLNIYDIAAGVVILREAGGIVTDFNGRLNFPEHGIAAANPYLHKELINQLTL